jgi:integrase
MAENAENGGASAKRFGPTKTGLRRELRTGVYYINVKVHGRNISESTGSTSATIAKKILAERMKDLRDSEPLAPSGASGNATFADIIRDFKLRIEGDNISAKTMLKRGYVIESFVKSWAAVPELIADRRTDFLQLRPKDVTEYDLLAWRKAFLGEYSADYFNKTLSLLRKLFDLAKRKYHFYGRNPLEDIQPARVQQTELILPSQEQFARILELLDEYRSFGGTVAENARHAKDFIEGLAYTGLRKEEANLLHARHVDTKDWLLRLPAEIVKNRRNARTVPIVERARPLFTKLVEESVNRGGVVFAVKECQKTLDRLCKLAQCPRITHHDLRHYFASLALHYTKDPKLVAKWLGHADGGVLVMRVYAHVFSKHEEEAVKLMKF